MSDRIKQAISAVISGVVALCVRRAWGTIAVALFMTVMGTLHLVENLKINTDNEDMLSSELAFRQNSIAMDRAFPQLDDTLLIILEAPDPDIADEKTDILVDALRAQNNIFAEVFAPENDPFFRQNGLLYLDLDELDRLYVRLAAAQPFLGTLWQQPNLSGLADITELLADAEELDESNLTEMARVYEEMARVTNAVINGEDSRIVWSSLLFDREMSGDIERRLISVKPRLNYGSLQPAEMATEAVYATAETLGLSESDIRLRLTGGVILQEDELRSVEKGMGLAGIISLLIVTGVLVLGLRSPGMMCALLVTLVIGLIWTATIAIFWVGEFNLISVAFAVLFVGLSVDFGIHFTLRATEFLAGDQDWRSALVSGASSVGPSLLFCAITTAIAFFSFLPTSYVGLAELGVIAGTGMFVALITNLTVLPALLRLMVRRPSASQAVRASGGNLKLRAKTAKWVLWGTVLSVLVALWLARDVRFDFDPMNLRDHSAPSMETLFDLADTGDFEPYTADLLLSDLSKLPDARRQLEGLETVARVESIDDLVPSEMGEKRAIVDDLALIIGASFFTPQGDVEMPQDSALEMKRSLIQNLNTVSGQSFVGPSISRLATALAKVPDERITDLNEALFGGLPLQLQRLNELLDPAEITIDALPDHLTSRYISSDGQVRLEIIPDKDLRDPVAIKTFVKEVQSVAPHATGGPIIVVEAGAAVLKAFLQALIYSVVGIGLFLLVTLRSWLDVVLVFVPVAIASTWVLGVSTLFDLPFNFANVIVLPLLFGLSVDFGLHLVIRERESRPTAHPSTTPRAILLSALTTLGSFGSIMLSGHPGTSSMGVLLTISILLSIVAILIVLPALMVLIVPRQSEG